MSGNPSRLSRFWEELKRRKVVRVMAMYAATAYIIIETADIVLPRLGLPEWTVTFLIILIIAGFPITIILSWIFDITPEGVVKTESAELIPDQKPGSAPALARKRLNASNIIIAVLLVVVCILLYPKVFNSDRFSKLRDVEGMISVAVLPFDNLTGDSSLYFWQSGISEYLINGLGNSDELAVWSSQIISDVLEGTRQVSSASLAPDIARKTASKINVSTYITGNFIGTENDFSIMLNLMNTNNGELIWSTKVDGDLGSNYRVVLDRLSDTVRNYMEIKALEESVERDLSIAYPNSAEAYRHYIDGLNAIVASNYETAIESLLMAYEIDTTFTFAAFYLAFAHNLSGQSDLNEGTFTWTKRAHELKNNLPTGYHPWIELWYACFITLDIDDILRYCNLLDEAALHSRFLMFDLGITYQSFLEDYEKSIDAFKKLDALNRQWEDDWKYDRFYNEYCKSLLMADRPEEVDRIADIGLKVNPENGWLELAKGAKSIMLNDSVAIPHYKEEIRAIARKYNFGEPWAQHYIGEMHCWAKDSLHAADYFRRAYELDRERFGSLGMLIECQLRSNIKIEECLRLSEYGLEKRPEWTWFLWEKGLSLHKLGNHEKALTILQEVEEKWPGYNRYLQKDVQEVERALASQN